MSALSSHLLEQHYSFHRSRAPFGQPLHSSQIFSSGPMAYAPQMHGSFPSNPSFAQARGDYDSSMVLAGISGDMSMADTSSASYMDLSTSTAQKIASLQAKLDKRLGPEYISQRPGPGGGPKLTYVEGWKIINLANEVFGFNGWSSSIVNLNTDFIDYSEETRRYSVGTSAVVRVTLRDGTYHEDVGYGILENSKSKGAALDKCKKEAVTDGIKRALRNFGNLLGNCLYDKSYAQEVIKIKVPPPKFDKDTLHRRPEFDDSAAIAKPENRPTTAKPSIPPIIPKALGTGTYAQANNSSKPTNVLPPHMRPGAAATPLRNNVPGPSKIGLNTPNQTPQGKASLVNTSTPLVPLPKSILKTDKAQNQVHAVNRVPNVQPTKILPVQKHQQRQEGPVPLNELEREDTYSFGSEDDAFFAEQLNLAEAEADIGRPIESDEGIGGAIDYDEGGPDCNVSLLSSSTNTKVTLHTVHGKQSSNKPSHAQASLAQVKPSPPEAKGATPANSVRDNGEAALRQDDADEISRQILALRRQKNAARSGNQTLQSLGQDSTASTSNNTTTTISKTPMVSLPPKPALKSVGGFNFPPNMSPGIPVGAKRGIEMLSSRGPGLGLAQQDTQSNMNAQLTSNGARQPLSTIEGGDLKRVRR